MGRRLYRLMPSVIVKPAPATLLREQAVCQMAVLPSLCPMIERSYAEMAGGYAQAGTGSSGENIGWKEQNSAHAEWP